jgi:hypothetical protein
MNRWAYWQEHWEVVKAILDPLGLYRREGTSECLFLRPNDTKMALLEAGHKPTEDEVEPEGYLQGPHIWVVEWKARGNFADNRRLIRTMRKLIGHNGRVGGRDRKARRLLNGGGNGQS